MVKIIAHRINKVNQLKDISKHFGFETDARDYKSYCIKSRSYRSGEKRSFIKKQKKQFF